jgi:hypothetical protein
MNGPRPIFVSLHRPKWRIKGLLKKYKYLEQDLLLAVLLHRNMDLPIGTTHHVETTTHIHAVERVNRTLFRVCPELKKNP